MRLALSGKTCSGKGTVAAELGFTEFAFADGLKDEIIALLALHGVPLTRSELNSRKSEFRSILQAYGNLMREQVGEFYWVARLLNSIPTTIENVAVTDCRFPNEVVQLEYMGYTVIRLNVSLDTQLERYKALYGVLPSPEQLHHLSETALDTWQFKYVVDADAPIDNVVSNVVEYLRQDNAKDDDGLL